MTLYPANPKISDSDKRLIALLARLLLENEEAIRPNSNRSTEIIPLSDSDAHELIDRLEEFASSRSFIASTSFIEALTNDDESIAKEIYLDSRRRNGRTRVMSSRQWAEFKRRFGLKTHLWPGPTIGIMPFSYFKRMEKELLLKCGLNPQVVDLVLSIIDKQKEEIETIRIGNKALKAGLVREALLSPIKSWREKTSKLYDYQISPTRAAAAITVVSDVAVMFTTRDWGVTGTMSTIAGGLATSILPDTKK